MAAVKKLLFVDANILLDFYRARTEAGLGLLHHLEQISDRIITSFQLEMEFKKNRHAAIVEGLNELKPQQGMSRPGLFSDAKAVKAIQASQKAADARIKKLRARYLKALRDPSANDPVYQVCQRIFHKDDPLVLKLTDPKRHVIRRKAMRRFLLGCPPRKRSDTSIGDAINWEWMVQCALDNNAELVIVSRDTDYGMVHDGQCFVNDHLKQEFSERVSRKRKILLYNKLSDALTHFKIHVSEKEKQEEEALVKLHGEVGLPDLHSRDALDEPARRVASSHFNFDEAIFHEINAMRHVAMSDQASRLAKLIIEQRSNRIQDLAKKLAEQDPTKHLRDVATKLAEQDPTKHLREVATKLAEQDPTKRLAEAMRARSARLDDTAKAVEPSTPVPPKANEGQ